MQQVNQALSDHGGAALPRDKQDLLRGQICDLWRHNNPVRTVTGQDGGVSEDIRLLFRSVCYWLLCFYLLRGILINDTAADIRIVLNQ